MSSRAPKAAATRRQIFWSYARRIIGLAHRGELLIERDHEGVATFRHLDGTADGDAIASRLIDAHARVFSALRQLGFRECVVKGVLAELRGDAELYGAPVERPLREALGRIWQITQLSMRTPPSGGMMRTRDGGSLFGWLVIG